MGPSPRSESRCPRSTSRKNGARAPKNGLKRSINRDRTDAKSWKGGARARLAAMVRRPRATPVSFGDGALPTEPRNRGPTLRSGSAQQVQQALLVRGRRFLKAKLEMNPIERCVERDGVGKMDASHPAHEAQFTGSAFDVALAVNIRHRVFLSPLNAESKSRNGTEVQWKPQPGSRVAMPQGR